MLGPDASRSAVHGTGRTVEGTTDGIGRPPVTPPAASVAPPTTSPTAPPAEAAGSVGASSVAAAGAAWAPSAGAPASTTSLLWSIALPWSAWAVASASRPWLMITPWSLRAWAVESTESTLAPTAASIGAATLALAATARSMGAAASMARLMSASRSRWRRPPCPGVRSHPRRPVPPRTARPVPVRQPCCSSPYRSGTSPDDPGVRVPVASHPETEVPGMGRG